MDEGFHKKEVYTYGQKVCMVIIPSYLYIWALQCMYVVLEIVWKTIWLSSNGFQNFQSPKIEIILNHSYVTYCHHLESQCEWWLD